MQSGTRRLAHGWILRGSGIPLLLLRDFIRPAVRAVPSSMARRLGPCCISLPDEAAPGAASLWRVTRAGLDVSVSTRDVELHDIAMDLLLCLGQALWERLSDAELRAYWTLLQDEIGAGIEGEIDEQALEEKRRLFAERSEGTGRLDRLGRASFAGTAAEYVHCLWHDVSIRTGPEFLPAERLRRRLELLARWFPPDRGYRLFPGRRTV